MPTLRKPRKAAATDKDFLIVQNPAGPNAIVERVLEVRTVGLPESTIAAVEMIKITEKRIPLRSAANKAAHAKRTSRQH